MKDFEISNNLSFCLNLIRAFAAQAVCLGHILLNWDYADMGLQFLGVVLFFIISGFLISATIEMKTKKNSDYSFKEYVVERFSRIYSGLIPCLFFIAIADWYFRDNLMHAKMGGFVENYNLHAFFGNILLLQNSGSKFLEAIHPIFSINTFSTGRPLWSVSVEWWLYLFYGWIILWKNKEMGGYPLVFLALSLIPAWHVVGGKGDGIAIVWFFGVVAYFMLSRNLGQSIPVKYCFLFFGSLVSLGLVKAFVSPNFVKFYDKAAIALLVFALFFLFTGLQKLKGTVSPEIHSIVNFFADYSYTLYLIHFTVIWSILALDMTAKYNVSKVETLLLAYLLSNLLAIAMAYLGEKKHLKIRKKLKSWLMDRNTENSKFRTVR